ncbi:MAG: LamG-like jellyroll fold domain-containing protein, partial [Dehalococcoidia bacterium]
GFYFAYENGRNNDGGCGSPAPVTAGQWVFVAATFDGLTKTCKVYVDGVLIDTQLNAYELPDTGVDLEIGQAGYKSRLFVGLIDDVRIHSGALTATEIAALANGGSLPPPDDTPPSAATGLTATAASESQIDLSWTAASDADSGVASYNIYRNGTRVGSSSGTSFSDMGLTEATSYTYEVSAVNGAGLEGSRSGPVTRSTLADTTAPTIVRVSAGSAGSSVQVAFSEPVDQASATNAANYQIDNGVLVSSASLAGDLMTVTLTTSSYVEGTYTLTVSGVRDRATTPNTIGPNSQMTYTFALKLVVSNLLVASGATYEVVEDGLVTDALIYIDRGATFIDIPAGLTGATYIKTANDDKFSTDDPFLTFEVNRDVTIYVAHAESSRPAWLASFADTGDQLVSGSAVYALLSKDFPAGTVALGGNGGKRNMYSVVLPAGTSSGSAPPVTFPTLPGMSGPAQDLDGDGTAEDVNGNGRRDFADIVVLFNNLGGSEVTGNVALFDFSVDGQVNMADVVALFDDLTGG